MSTAGNLTSTASTGVLASGMTLTRHLRFDFRYGTVEALIPSSQQYSMITSRDERRLVDYSSVGMAFVRVADIP